jgi:hypothetical protein
MAVNTFVQVNILAAVAAPTQPAFNIGGVIGTHTVWSDITRTYTSLQALNSDFPAVESSAGSDSAGIAKAGAAFFSQSPNPGVFKVFRGTSKPTKTFTITQTVATDSTAYSCVVSSLTATFTSGVGSTTTSIATGLAAAITALGVAGVTAAAVGAVITITGTNGTWYYVDISASNGGGQQLLETTGDPGYAAMLAVIALADTAWYGLTCVTHSKAAITAVAAWAEANSKVFFTASSDYDQLTGSTSDVMSALKAGTYNRTAIWAHQNQGQFVECAVMGFFFPFTPGSVNYFMKSLSGITVAPSNWLNDTGVANVLSKNGNVYRSEAGLAVTYNGTMASGRFIDITTGIDYMTARLQNRLIQAMVNSQKIPYTTAGAGVIEQAIRSQIQEEIDIGFAANDSNIAVNVPAVASQASTDRAARIMRNCNFTFRAAGAVQSVIINGIVTV